MTEPAGIAPHGLSLGLTNYGDPDFALYLRRSFARSMGYSTELLQKPVIGIADTRSGFNNCHRHFPELIEAVKRGVNSPRSGSSARSGRGRKRVRRRKRGSAPAAG